MDHQRNLRAQLQTRHLRAHAQRERCAARRAALFCFSDTSHKNLSPSLYTLPAATIPPVMPLHAGTRFIAVIPVQTRIQVFSEQTLPTAHLSGEKIMQAFETASFDR